MTPSAPFSVPLSATLSVPLRGLFIAGTDTGVGKTIIATALVACARNRAISLVPFKPVETGADPTPADAVRLLEAFGASLDLGAVCPYPLRLPAAPQAAAEHQGVTLSPDLILAHARRIAHLGQGLVVESAGGLLAPFAPGFTGADLAAALGLPILLVGRTALGTINHVALSINELRRRQLPLAGLILVDTHPQRGLHEDRNADLIHQITGVRPLAVFPFVQDTAPAHLADTLVATTDPADLARLLAPGPGAAAPLS